MQSRSAAYWLAILALNVTIALALRAIAPSQPVTSDLGEYSYVAEHTLQPGCPATIYCYRVLLPWAIDHLPGPPEDRWRWVGFIAETIAGTVMAVIGFRLTRRARAGVLATILTQTQFGFAYTAYDPYTPDPVVFLMAALVTLAWISDRPIAAAAIGILGIFAKEAIALVAAAAGFAAAKWLRGSSRLVWVGQALTVWVILVSYHIVADATLGWSVAGNRSANLAGGSWLLLWISTVGPKLALFYIFVPFGLGWLYALLGYGIAPIRIRALTLGYVLPLAGLVYVQNPERALANAFFVVVPLAVVFLARLPAPLGIGAAITNGVFTAKVGLSTTWLPSSALLLFPAVAVAVWAIWTGYRRSAIWPRPAPE